MSNRLTEPTPFRESRLHCPIAVPADDVSDIEMTQRKQCFTNNIAVTMHNMSVLTNSYFGPKT